MCPSWRAHAVVGMRLAIRRVVSTRSVALVVWGAFAVVVVGLITTLPHAFERAQRVTNARAPQTEDLEAPRPSPGRVNLESQPTTYRGAPLMIVALDGRTAKVPPGVSELPAPGEMVVSPALGRLLALRARRDELAVRLPGIVVSEVRADGLARPEELLAYVNVGKGHLGQQAVPLTGWGAPPGLAGVEPLSPHLLVILSMFVAVPLVGLGMLAIGAGRADRASVVDRLHVVGAGGVAVVVMAAAEALLPITAGIAAGFLARRQVAELVADRFAASVRPFAGDLVPSGAVEVARLALVVATLALVAIGYAIWPKDAGRRVAGLRRWTSRVVPVGPWIAALVVLGVRLSTVNDLGSLDISLFLVLMATTPAVQVRFVALVLALLAKGRSVVAQVTNSSFRALGSEATRAQQAVALTLASLALAAAAIVLWDAASLVDARWGLGRSRPDVAWISTNRAVAVQLARDDPSTARLLRLEAEAGWSNDRTSNVVVSCEDAAAVIVAWNPADCGSILSRKGEAEVEDPTAVAEFGGVRLHPKRQVAVELRAPIDFVGGSIPVMFPVPAKTFADIDRGVDVGSRLGSDLVVVALRGSAAQHAAKVEALRELTADSVRNDGALPVWMGDEPGSNVLVLGDLEREGRRYQEVYGTANRLVAALAAAIGALAFFIGTLIDARVVQPTTDRLELLGARRRKLVAVGLLRGQVSLVVALITGGLAGTIAGLRYLRTPGYEDQLTGWLHGYPAVTIGVAILASLVAGTVVCVVAGLVGVRPDPVERLKAR